VGIFHLSFILIVLGAGITRYVSFEGIMHIREGESSASIVSADSYFSLNSGDRQIKQKVLFSELSSGAFDEKININGQQVRFKSVGFIKNAQRTPVSHPGGSPWLTLLFQRARECRVFLFNG
jgi:cytochrome c biogenesis protein ResB